MYFQIIFLLSVAYEIAADHVTKPYDIKNFIDSAWNQVKEKLQQENTTPPPQINFENNEYENYDDLTQPNDEPDWIQRSPYQPLKRVKRAKKSTTKKKTSTTAHPDKEKHSTAHTGMPPKRWAVYYVRKIAGYKILKRNVQGETSKGYQGRTFQHPAPVADFTSNYLNASLPVFLVRQVWFFSWATGNPTYLKHLSGFIISVWGFVVLLVVFGLRPGGPVSRWLFSSDHDSLTRKI